MSTRSAALTTSVLMMLICGCTSDLRDSGSADRTLTLGDGTTITHPWDAAGPLPARDDWVKVEVAGYLLSESRESDGFSWTWTFTLALNHRQVNMIAVSDVTGPDTTRLVAMGEGVISNDKWLAQSSPQPVSPFHLPWLFREGESIRILRFSVADETGDTRILYQPVAFGPDTKRRLLSITTTDAPLGPG